LETLLHELVRGLKKKEIGAAARELRPDIRPGEATFCC
jgi:hypothetical protein